MNIFFSNLSIKIPGQPDKSHSRFLQCGVLVLWTQTAFHILNISSVLNVVVTQLPLGVMVGVGLTSVARSKGSSSAGQGINVKQ